MAGKHRSAQLRHRVAAGFGPARGEEWPESDIVILVEFSGRKSLLDIVGIEQELSDGMGSRVDLLTEKSISPYLIDRIKKEMVVLFG